MDAYNFNYFPLGNNVKKIIILQQIDCVILKMTSLCKKLEVPKISLSYAYYEQPEDYLRMGREILYVQLNTKKLSSHGKGNTYVQLNTK